MILMGMSFPCLALNGKHVFLFFCSQEMLTPQSPGKWSMPSLESGSTAGDSWAPDGNGWSLAGLNM